MAKKEKNTPKKTVKSVNVEEKKIEEIVETPETPVETGVEEEVKEEVKEVLDAKEQVEEEVLPAVEEKKEEEPNKESCDCKRQLTAKDVFGYMWMGQIYGE